MISTVSTKGFRHQLNIWISGTERERRTSRFFGDCRTYVLRYDCTMCRERNSVRLGFGIQASELAVIGSARMISIGKT